MDIISRLKEAWAMRKYAKVQILEKTKRTEVFSPPELLRFGSISEVFRWVCDNIRYVREDKDYWQTPLETLKRKAGDCEDGSILLASLFCSILPKNERWRVLVAVYEKPAHVVVVYHGRVYDWTQKRIFSLKEISNWKLWYIFNYHQAYTTKENVKKWRNG